MDLFVGSSLKSILDVCRTIMEFHPPCSIQKSLGKLLICLGNFDDIDVKDRARLYRNILIHVREPFLVFSMLVLMHLRVVKT